MQPGDYFGIVAPVEFTDANLVASNVPEDEPVWSSSVTYEKDDRVRVGHMLYQSTIDGNTNRNPLTDIESWAEVGPSNRWAALDGSTSSKTYQATLITYQFKFGRAVTSLHVLDTTAVNSIRVYVVDPVYGTVYDNAESMGWVPRQVGWWEWFFGQRASKHSASFDLPTFPNAEIYVEINGTADMGVGVIAAGNIERYSLGMGARTGSSVGIQDFSRKERNDFGDSTLVKRNFAKRGSFTMMVKAGEVDSLIRRMEEIRATPCLFIASYRYDATRIFGFYKDFDLIIEYYNYSIFQITIEGLT